MIITKMHLLAAHGAARPRRHAGAAAARQHGAGADRARARPPRRRCAGSACSTCPTACRCRTGSRRPKGRSQELPATLQSLDELKDRVLLCGGLADEAANLVKGGGDHARSAGTFLTCVPFKITVGRRRATRRCRWTRSRRAEFAKETQLASLELGIESNAMLGACDGGASCAYTNTIAWRTPTTPLPIENDPRAVFERLFGTSGSTDPRARLARMQRDKSILDFVGSEVASLEKVIGPQRQDQDRRSTSTRCATSSGGSRWPRRRTPASCRSSISRSACRATTPSTPS